MSSTDSSRARIDALDAELADELDAARLGQRHLRRAVDVQRRRQPLDQPREAQVLHDHRIDAGRGDRADVLAPPSGSSSEKISVLNVTKPLDVVAVQVRHRPPAALRA